LTHFRYNCKSKSGYEQGGVGQTELELGSEEHTTCLLHEVAQITTKAGVSWDPFNIRLTVWAQSEPGLNIKTMDVQQLLAIFNSIFPSNDH
jgi:hypothetical protein